MYGSPKEAGFSAQRIAEARTFYDTINAAGWMVVYDGAVLIA